MGNECKVCNKSNAENELIIGSCPLIRQKIEPYDNYKNGHKYYTYKEIINLNPENYNKLFKLKTAILAHQDRKIYKNMLKKYREEKKKFSNEELFETLNENNLFKDLLLTKKDVYKYKSGAEYSGEWLGGFRHGHGIMKWEDGVVYEGEWKYGFAEGFGELQYPTGEYLKGNFKYNKLNGYGEVHNTENGYEYWGNWENDQQTGQGREKWEDGSSYEGNYELGVKSGLGKYTWEDGTYYHGQWKNNKISGLGIYEWPDGRKYIGEWKNAKMNGFGISIWTHGKYIGYYEDDKKSGFGIYIDKDNNKYEGFWEKGQHSKLGKITKNDGSSKLGFSENNRLKKIITNEKELQIKNEEIERYVKENKDKEIIIKETINKILNVNESKSFSETV